MQGPVGGSSNGTCTSIIDAINCSGDADCPTNVVATAATVLFPNISALLPDEVDSYTLFVPINPITTILIGDYTGGKYTQAEIVEILNGHIVVGLHKAADLTDGQKLATVANTTLTVQFLGTDLMIMGPAGDVIKVVDADFQGGVPEGMTANICPGSVAHVVDGVFARRSRVRFPPPLYVYFSHAYVIV